MSLWASQLWAKRAKHAGCLEAHRVWHLPRILVHWQPTPVLLPGKSHGQGSLAGCSPWGRKELDTTERLHFHFLSLLCPLCYVWISVLGFSTQSPPILGSAGACGGSFPNKQSMSTPSLGVLTPKVGVSLEGPCPGNLGPSLAFCLPGRPGLPRELGAADHCPGARGSLHLLPEAAAAPDD